MKKLSKAQVWDYFILAARIWLAVILIIYGGSKLTGHQFGSSEETMNLPLKDIDLLRISWYLADHEPFKSFIGISQIIAAILLIYNRTVILGALMAIPIWMNILIWDMSFMGLSTPFTFRMAYYLLLTFLILWHYKDRIIQALQNITKDTAPKFRYPFWAYLALLPIGFALELIWAGPRALIDLIGRVFRLV